MKKATIPVAVVRSGLQAAIALSPSLAGHHTSLVANVPSVDVDESRQTPPGLAVHLGDEIEVIRAPTITMPRTWDEASARLFDHLVEKEALGTANKSELNELENLSALRRQTEMPRTGEEVLREYEQAQLIRNLLCSLTSYVQFEQETTRGQGATRPRSKEKA